jgi:hypothetical protein
MYVTIIFIAAYAYIGWRLDRALAEISSSSPSSKRRALILFGAILLNLYPVATLGAYFLEARVWATAVSGGSPTMDYLLTYPFWVGLLTAGQLLPFVLLLDLVRGVARPFVNESATRKLRLAKVTVIIVCLIALYTPLRIYFDTTSIRTRERTIHSTKLPPNAPELRIAHISDVQLDRRTGPELVERFVTKVNALNPDLVVFSGDAVTSGTQFIDQAAALMGRIEARYGVFACLGDHDHWADGNWVEQSFRNNGIEMVRDQTRRLQIESWSLDLTGVTNIYSRRPNQRTLDQLAAEKSDEVLSILLTHQPSNSLVEWAERRKYDLFLAGHTHGGQVVLNVFGIRVAPIIWETDFVSGFYQVGEMLVSVTNGLGLTFAPIRFQAPAEITLIRVQPEQAGNR